MKIYNIQKYFNTSQNKLKHKIYIFLAEFDQIQTPEKFALDNNSNLRTFVKYVKAVRITKAHVLTEPIDNRKYTQIGVNAHVGGALSLNTQNANCQLNIQLLNKVT